MLKARILSAIVMALTVLGAVLWLSTDQLALFFGVIVMLCAWEWAGLLNIEGSTRPLSMLRISYPLFIAYILYSLTLMNGMEGVIWIGATGWVFALLWMMNPGFARAATINNALLKGFTGLWVLIPTWAALMYLHGHEQGGPVLVLYVMSITWVADIGAFFSGRRFGRVKLAPALSPGKTREGAYGALLLVALYSLLCGWLLQWPLLNFVLLSVVAALFSVFGDLFESLFKRQADVKDSSQLIPGHGGFLDRLDSLMAAAPIFALGMILS